MTKRYFVDFSIFIKNYQNIINYSPIYQNKNAELIDFQRITELVYDKKDYLIIKPPLTFTYDTWSEKEEQCKRLGNRLVMEISFLELPLFNKEEVSIFVNDKIDTLSFAIETVRKRRL